MTSKPKCEYGATCYRKNRQHLKDYDHSDVDVEACKVKEIVVSYEDENEPAAARRSKRKSTDEGAQAKKRNNNTGTEGMNQKKILDSFFDKKNKFMKDTKSDDGKIRETGKCSDKRDKFEEDEIPSSSEGRILTNEEASDKLKQLYQVEMPDDLYQFWDFCRTMDVDKPAMALKSMKLTLVGPYDIFSGKYPNTKDGTNFHLNHRYYYDPPEFMTLIAGDDDQFHLGYFWDDPNELPSFVASNAADSNCLLTVRGENLFSAVNWYLQDRQKKTKEKSISKILEKLCHFAEAKEICLDLNTPKLKQRQKKVVCKTFHGAGLVVPVDKNDVGYRPVPETPANLKKILKKIVESETEDEQNLNLEPLEEIITFVQFANDECDYGEGIELGLDLFSYGSEVLHPFISSLLRVGYNLLKRNLFADIIREFLPVRHKNKPFIIPQ